MHVCSGIKAANTRSSRVLEKALMEQVQREVDETDDEKEKKKMLEEDACAYRCVVLSSNQSLALVLGVQKATLAKSCYQEDGVPFGKGRGGEMKKSLF